MAGVKGRSGGWNRKSVAEHVLQGTYRADRHGPRVALALAGSVPSPESPPPPRGLSRASRQRWQEAMAGYEGWKVGEVKLFELALRACDEADACRARILAEGLTVPGPRGDPRP